MPGTKITVEQVVKALVSFEDALTPEMPVKMANFSQARVALAKAINSFVADESEQVALLQRIGIADAPESEQRQLYNDLIAVRFQYSAHISKWTGGAVASDWRRYRADSITLIIAMRKILRARLALRSATAASNARQP